MKISFNSHFSVKVLIDNLDVFEVEKALKKACYMYKILNYKKHPGYSVKMHEFSIHCCLRDATVLYNLLRDLKS